MKCNDFQTIAHSDILTMTRAERASALSHYHDCEACREWLFDKVGRKDPGPCPRIDWQLDEDSRDPEWCEQVDAAVARRMRE